MARFVTCSVLLALCAPECLRAADLQPATVAAFERYIRLTEVRIDQELNGQRPFLWVDSLSADDRRDADARLARGEVVVTRMETRDASKSIGIPDGLCHHWLGTVFISGAGLDRVKALMQSYDQYQEIYRPAVRASRLVSRDGDHFRVYLQLFMNKVVSVVLNTEYDVRYLAKTPKQMQVRSATTRIAEVTDPDTARPQEKPVGHDNGFLWRFNNYCAIEERAGGTYVQCESLSLSRGIPTGLGWLVGPFVTSIPKDTLEFTLKTLVLKSS